MKHTLSEKTLVPIANPGHLEKLMDLACLFHSHKKLSIYPLTIINKAAESEQTINIAHELLVTASNNIKSTNWIHLEPIIRSDVNIAIGISKAIDEMGADNTIIGWNQEELVGYRIFGSILDQLLVFTNQLLLVYKAKTAAADHKRIVLAIPPGSHEEPGFEELMGKTLNMAGSLKLKLEVLAEFGDIPVIRTIIQNYGMDVPAVFNPLILWDDLTGSLKGILNKDDLIFLVGARKGSISCRQNLELLPRKLAERYPENSMIIAYSRIKNPVYNSYFDP